MEIFPKIAKTILVLILLVTIYSYITDMGKTFVVHSENSFIARNASSYTTKFTVKESNLQQFKSANVTVAEAAATMEKYFSMQYENRGYELSGESIKTGSKLKLVYIPKFNKLPDGQNYQHLGPIYVRIILEGFEGAPANRLGEADTGLAIINIEQKIPTSFRHMMKGNAKLSQIPDNEGFWGYYSIRSDYAFTMSVINDLVEK